MKIIQTIVIDEQVASNPKFRELKRTRKLSQVVNDFIKTHLNIVDEVVNKDIQSLQDELNELNVRKAILNDKVKEIERKAIAEKEREAKEKEELEKSRRVLA